MRKTLMTLTLVALMALPVLAQRQRGGFGFGGQTTGDGLLTNKSVQEELKLDDKQKESLKELGEKAREIMKEGGEAFKSKDKEKIKELMDKVAEVRTKGLKKVKESLTSLQSKRFGEIQIQVAKKTNDANLFKREEIQKLLKLTDKQKDSVKETLADLDKDVKEVRDDAKGDRAKAKASREKITTLQKDAFEKISKALTEDQAKSLKDASGESFEYKSDFGGFGKDKGKGKGNKKDKKDDF
jgi:Spy/CpxP family protein refolding chaperone